jgi:ABC-2 type transport system ATP-binding protein
MLAKVKIAAAMSRVAPYYLLDEPLNGIDLIARDEVMETIIRSLSDEATIIISSHLVEELEPYVNKALFFKQGHLIEECDVEELRSTKGISLADHYRELMKWGSLV